MSGFLPRPAFWVHPKLKSLVDLQGRIVHRERIRATGTGRDTFELRAGSLAQPLPPGIYFARATDSLQRVSNAAKVLILR